MAGRPAPEVYAYMARYPPLRKINFVLYHNEQARGGRDRDGGRMMASWDRRYSRRQFIRGAAGVATGAVAMGSAGGLLAACGNSSTSTSTKLQTGALPLKRDPETLVVAMDAFTNDFDPASYFLLAAIVPSFGVYDSLMR